MNLKSKTLIAILAITMTFGAGVVSASGINELIEVAMNKVNVEINGVKMQSDNILYNGRTYVQLKEVCEALGKKLTWDGDTFTAAIIDKPLVETSTISSVPSDYSVIPTHN